MPYIKNKSICPDHGEPKKRDTCQRCNAAYMRDYYRKRTRDDPEWAIWHRAKKRADKMRIPFDLPVDSVVIPEFCPILGTAFVVGAGRVPESPSLDRVNPSKGYVLGNCRVISDHANRLKSNLGYTALRARAECGTPTLRGDYAKIAEYVCREELLTEVRLKEAAGGDHGSDWAMIATFLEARFRSGQMI